MIMDRGGSRDFKGGVHNLLLIQVSFFQWFFKPHIVKQIKWSLRLLCKAQSACMHARGVWGHAPLENFALKCYLRALLSIASYPVHFQLKNSNEVN